VVVAKQPVGSVYVITTTPGDIPVKTPEKESMVAIVTFPLVHMPPGGVAFNSTELPTQTDAPGTPPEPVVITGFALTVTVVVTKHPAGSIYVTLAIPGEIPVTTPESEPIVAIVTFPLVQVPPVGVLLKPIVPPTQTADGPVIMVGIGLTVTTIEVEQPVGKVYIIVVVPAATPVSIPESEPMVATEVLVLVQTPPPGVPGIGNVLPAQMLSPVEIPMFGV